jgi:hypothetical protein
MCLGGVVFWALDLDDGDNYGSSVLDEVFDDEEKKSNIHELMSKLKEKMDFYSENGEVSDNFFDKLADSINDLRKDFYLSDLEQKQVFDFNLDFSVWHDRKGQFSSAMVSRSA